MDDNAVIEIFGAMIRKAMDDYKLLAKKRLSLQGTKEWTGIYRSEFYILRKFFFTHNDSSCLSQRLALSGLDSIISHSTIKEKLKQELRGEMTNEQRKKHNDWIKENPVSGGHENE